jgi:hypothetical protein
VLSVTPVLTFSISTGLAASTVTPGIAAPDASRTVPARLWARASAGKSAQAIRTAARFRRKEVDMEFLRMLHTAPAGVVQRT